MPKHRTERARDTAVELDEADLERAQGGFTPSTGAEKMEYSSRIGPHHDGLLAPTPRRMEEEIDDE